MNEPLPLAVIHDTILRFLRGRDDAVLFGAHAVNAYVDEPRMTQDVDVLSTRGVAFAEELRVHLHQTHQMATRMRAVRPGLAYRIYQKQTPKDRHLADVRAVDELPPHQLIGDVAVETPPVLIADKLVSALARSNQPKGRQDEADLWKLLLTFPELKQEEGAVADRLQLVGVADEVLLAWRQLVARNIEPDDEGLDW